ncbi:hypothetical protein [Dokdonia sp.]|uniref:hypothetical protein n=1 Tax=Dokdonia sp. TaxID=2024995 RepID=UPI0032678ACB
MKNSKIAAGILFIVLTFVYACTTDENTNAPETAAQITAVIGVQENGEFHINDENALKSKWEQTLRTEGHDVTLERFDFVDVDLDGSGEYNMILMASSIDGTVKIATAITLGEEINNVRRIMAIGGSVTCTGCTVGCNPKDHAEYGWTCTPCVTSGTCTKSETVETISVN